MIQSPKIFYNKTDVEQELGYPLSLHPTKAYPIPTMKVCSNHIYGSNPYILYLTHDQKPIKYFPQSSKYLLFQNLADHEAYQQALNAMVRDPETGNLFKR